MPTSGYYQPPAQSPPAFTSSQNPPSNAVQNDLWLRVATGNLIASAGSSFTYNLRCLYKRSGSQWVPQEPGTVSITGITNAAGRATLDLTSLVLQASPLLPVGIQVNGTASAGASAWANLVSLTTSQLDIQVFQPVTISILGTLSAQLATSAKTLFTQLVCGLASI